MVWVSMDVISGPAATGSSDLVHWSIDAGIRRMLEVSNQPNGGIRSILLVLPDELAQGRAAPSFLTRQRGSAELQYGHQR